MPAKNIRCQRTDESQSGMFSPSENGWGKIGALTNAAESGGRSSHPLQLRNHGLSDFVERQFAVNYRQEVGFSVV